MKDDKRNTRLLEIMRIEEINKGEKGKEIKEKQK